MLGKTALNADTEDRPASSKVKDVSDLKRGSGVSSGLDTAGKMEEEPEDEDQDEDEEEEEKIEVKKEETQYKSKTVLKRCPKVAHFLNAILDNKLTIGFMTVVTVWALFADDVRVLAVSNQYDEFFNGVTSFALVCFFVELIMGSLAQDGYIFGFYFWLDLVATVSLVSDIGWIWDPIMGTEELNADDISNN